MRELMDMGWALAARGGRRMHTPVMDALLVAFLTSIMLVAVGLWRLS